MDDTAHLLADTATRLFASHFEARDLAAAEAGTWPAAAWAAIVEAGLPGALLTEAQGGYGLDRAEALDLVRLAGAHAVPLPLGETMLAAMLLAEAGLDVPEGPLSFTAGPTLARHGAGWKLAGSAARVPWGARAATLAVLAEADGAPFIAAVAPGEGSVTAGHNMAGEPRDTIVFDTMLTADRVAPAASGWDRLRLRAAGAALRSLQIAGAMERVTAMTVQYAQDRVQFGRALGKFQAIQQSLAVMAGQTAAALAAGDNARDALAHGGSVLAIAGAKARAGEAAGIAAGLTHQIHGAIGFTYEHSLHYYTKRLWSWRDEYGSEAEWSLLLGRHLARVGPDRLWAELTTL